ncbi:MAG: alpha/beta hydrolase [Lachnospiraceae bacterium]|nr:alpha/beta hydrolase [Lachnospiraceae bacterium]
MEEKKLAVILPGVGYHKDMPLLYYSRKMARFAGYELLYITYHDLPTQIRGDLSKMHLAAETAYGQACEALDAAELSQYEELLFIGKSIGTVIAARYAKEREIDPKQIWYTPVEATFRYAPEQDGRVMAFSGDADPWAEWEEIRKLAEEKKIPLCSYPGCNHSLECGDVEKNLEILCDVMKKTKEML